MVPVCVHGVCEHVCVVSTSVCVCVILCVHRVCVFVSACMCDVSVCIHVEERCAGGQRNRNEGKDGRKPIFATSIYAANLSTTYITNYKAVLQQKIK